jgi:pSer/pThr/pTyr-binding forkhead associated (FHA) protein
MDFDDYQPTSVSIGRFDKYQKHYQADGTELLSVPAIEPKKTFAWLVVVAGPDTGVFLGLNEALILIGRDPDCNYTINDKSVSRQHFHIRWTSDENEQKNVYTIADLGSGNGTIINGQRVVNHVLQDEDFIKIGRTELIFKQLLMTNKLLHRATDDG